LVKVVNNAASVTRLNLSLRLHATIFKASRLAALPQLAFLLRSRERVRARVSVRVRGGWGAASGTRPTFAARLLRHLRPTTERSSCEENRWRRWWSACAGKTPPLSRSARFSECSAVGQFGNGNYVRHKTDIGHLVRSHSRLIVILDAVSPAQLSPRFSCSYQPPTGHPLHSRCHNIRSFQLIYTGN